jgi:outer membrane protein OmpA-like peptidoglycan-associated protein
MRRDRFVTACALVGVLSTCVVSVPLFAQERIDCRIQSCSVEFLDQALGPRLRGLDPQRTQAQTLQKPISVGLNVFFEFNSDQIVPKYYADLDTLGNVLARRAEERFHIEGHTDSIGSDAYNQTLSQKRAESVKRYLVQHFSIPPERLVTRGYGESLPYATNDTDEGRSTNRRVELVRK